MVRYEFGPSSRSRLAHWLSEAFCRDHHAMACGLRGEAGAGCRLPLSMPRRTSARGDCKRKPGNDLPTRSAARLGSNRDIGAHAALLEWRRDKRRLVFRLTMSRWQIHHSPAATQAARTFCYDALASEPLPDPGPAASFPYFSISNTDASRGAVRRPCRPSPRVFACDERVYHGQQNDHRRLTPGGNPGGGPARQSSRGI